MEVAMLSLHIMLFLHIVFMCRDLSKKGSAKAFPAFVESKGIHRGHVF